MSATLIILEHNKTFLRQISKLLEAERFNVIPCETALGAYKLATKQTVDLIITNIQLPKVSGLHLAKKLKSRPVTENIPVLFFGKKSIFDEKVIDRIQALYHHFIILPLNKAKLIEMIRRILNQDDVEDVALVDAQLEDPLPIHPKKGEWQRGGKYGQCIELSKAIVEICSVQGFDLGIIDGLTAVHYKSLANKVFAPSIIERSNMVIASTDMVAADAVATRIIGLDPKKILHIKWAVQRKLGTADLSKIEIRGKKIEEVEMRCVPMYRQKSVMLPAHK